MGGRRPLAGAAAVAAVVVPRHGDDRVAASAAYDLRRLPFEAGIYAFFAVLLVNVNIIALFGGKVHGVFSVLNLRHGEAARYLRMFELMYSMPDASSELDAVRARRPGWAAACYGGCGS